MYDAYTLGLGDPVAVSAEHGEGIADLMSVIVERLPDETAVSEATDTALKLAIVGRPNAGKSTLLNRLVGEERMVTGPEPGLTRDAVTVVLSDAQGRRIELVDTAGLRRRARIEAPLEKMSVGAAIGALRMAEMVVLAVDATMDAAGGLHDQDLQIAQLVEREGRGLVIALTKWDAVGQRSAVRKAIAERLETSLAQLRGVPVVALSALTGEGMEPLVPGRLESLRGVEYTHSHGGLEPMVRGGFGPAPHASGGQAAAEAALHHAGEGTAADFRGVRDARGAAAGRLSAVSGERVARDVRAGGNADPAAVAGNYEPVCRIAQRDGFPPVTRSIGYVVVGRKEVSETPGADERFLWGLVWRGRRPEGVGRGVSRWRLGFRMRRFRITVRD